MAIICPHIRALDVPIAHPIPPYCFANGIETHRLPIAIMIYMIERNLTLFCACIIDIPTFWIKGMVSGMNNNKEIVYASV